MSTTATDTLRTDPFWPAFTPSVAGQPERFILSWHHKERGRQERQLGSADQADLVIAALRADPEVHGTFIVHEFCPHVRHTVVVHNEIRGRREHQCQSADDAARLAADLRSDPYNREVVISSQPVRTSERFVIHDATGRPI